MHGNVCWLLPLSIKDNNCAFYVTILNEKRILNAKFSKKGNYSHIFITHHKSLHCPHKAHANTLNHVARKRREKSMQKWVRKKNIINEIVIVSKYLMWRKELAAHWQQAQKSSDNERERERRKVIQTYYYPMCFYVLTIMLRELPHDLCVIVTFSFVEVLFICCFALFSAISLRLFLHSPPPPL
jgi:hypothetical protein